VLNDEQVKWCRIASGISELLSRDAFLAIGEANQAIEAMPNY
jgi:hypothetical protein